MGKYAKKYKLACFINYFFGMLKLPEYKYYVVRDIIKNNTLILLKNNFNP